jgi:phage-related baseplate assembly protein
MTITDVSVTGRFAAPELLELGPPPDLASQPFETLFATAKAKLVADMATIGIAYDVENLETDSAVILTQAGVDRDMLRRRAVDDAIRASYLGSTWGAWLDSRAADYGVLRRIVIPADPGASPPVVEVLEDDDSLRRRARLSWEALSVAGPPGAYVFHALDAHVDTLDAVVYGPESGYVVPGEVLVVVQSRVGNGVPTPAMMDVIAARLDAYQVTYGDSTSVVRLVRDEQSVRPLGAKVLLTAVQPVTFNVVATIYIRPGPDAEVVRLAALAKLEAFLEKRKRIGASLPVTAIEAALYMVGEDGLPVAEEVIVTEPAQDIIPGHDELAEVGTITINVEFR